MSNPLRFGGHDHVAHADPHLDGLEELLGRLSWKYVTPDATFGDYDMGARGSDEYRGYIAHWAGRFWCHDNELPTRDALRTFDLMSLEAEFLAHVSEHGRDVFDVGMTIEEIWMSQQLYSAKPMVVYLADTFADQPLTRVGHLKAVGSSDSLVWLLAIACVPSPHTRARINVLVLDGESGHTITITGLNGLEFRHPRGDMVRAGWFSFHDPWPARSLLAPERNTGLRVLEDVTRPPYWLISPADLDKVIVGFLFSVDTVSLLRNELALHDFAKAVQPAGRPLWLEQAEDPPDRPFSLLLADRGGHTPTLVESLLGLARVRLFTGDVRDANTLLDRAYDLDPGRTAVTASNLFRAFGHDRLGKEWHDRFFGA